MKSLNCADFDVRYGRSPCGERGLKCYAARLPAPHRGLSLPVRGAWIEMLRREREKEILMVSLPVRGAWIEIFVW